MLNLILAWKTPNWTKDIPEILYCGNDGSEGLAAAQKAHKGGKYAKGKIGRVLVTTLIPVPPAGAATPKAFARPAAAKAVQAKQEEK